MPMSAITFYLIPLRQGLTEPSPGMDKKPQCSCLLVLGMQACTALFVCFYMGAGIQTSAPCLHSKHFPRVISTAPGQRGGWESERK